jgi:tetratricopeptide (TPR) repeat protein
MKLLQHPLKYWPYRLLLLGCICIINHGVLAQDSSKSILDINNSKLIKKVNSVLDSNQKKINNFIFKKIDNAKAKLDSTTRKFIPYEEERPLPYEILTKKKYTLGRRAYQNTVSKFNYIFHANEELTQIIKDARAYLEEDYTTLIPFYDYDLANTSKKDIDSIIYRCNANVVLHDLRSNWVDDAYLLLAKAYLFHKNFDTAGSLLQYINYAFDAKEAGMDIPIGSNLRNTKGQFSIATKEDNKFYENRNIRNESMLWQARNYFEINSLNEGLSLLQLLKTDAFFPKRLHPFLFEQLAYGYYQSENYDSAATYLTKGLSNAPDKFSKTRWYYLIAQLWEKSDNLANAYNWYKKAHSDALNPLISVYAKINLIKIDFKQTKTPWLELANSLQKMSKREKYKPYTDIIYFEMAKLAIQNKDIERANEWLLVSIKKNENGLKQKQKAFELLADINYKSSNYAVATLAYDSLTLILKTNPDFEKIALRKKWLPIILKNDITIQQQDTLQYIYTLAENMQQAYLQKWELNEQNKTEKLSTLFMDEVKQAALANEALTNQGNNNNFGNNGFGNNYGSNNGGNNGFSNTNNYGNNSTGNYTNTQSQGVSGVSDFYFENKNTVEIGKQNFTQKWGNRPNVDQWRRKTSSTIVYKSTNPEDAAQSRYTTDSSNKSNISISTTEITKEKTTSNQLITSKEALTKSMVELNKSSFENAQTFLFQLNDFEKALPLYQKVINLNIEDTITERSLLDLASEYIHQGNRTTSDSLIAIVEAKFPKGVYITKKTTIENKKSLEKQLEADYKEAYFLAQIGNWATLSNKANQLDALLKKTKWFAPYQFLKVKMFAQQRMDSLAFLLLDSIIYMHQNERIRDRAKNIIEELKKRKETELYLSKLNGDSLKSMATTTIPMIENLKQASQNKSLAISPKIDSASKDALDAGLFFTKDTLEPHYIALLTNNIKEILVKEMVTALGYLNKEDFKKQNLDVTYLEFEPAIFVVWIGPFENLNSSNTYLNKIKGRLSTEIISFVQSKQYELYILGKSNILQIKNSDDLKKYKGFMINNIYKQ